MIKLLSLTVKGFKRLDLKLTFPERGNVLITGMNESGKSTLFEAVYFSLFGTGLVPDKSHKSIRDLLSYESDICEVNLEFTIDTTYYSVKRVIKRTKDDNRRYTHELTIKKPNGQEEVVKGSSVSKQIELELGLDGDAMLNSCFVEQKNLDKLETSKKSERRDSISKLLNLEAFTEIESELRSRQKDLNEQRMQAEKRLNLARIATEVPKREDRLKTLERQLELIAILHEKSKIEDQIKEIEKRSGEAAKDIFEVEQKIKRISEIEKKIPEKENILREFKGLLSLLSKVNAVNEENKNETRRVKELRVKLSGLNDLKADVSGRKSSVQTLQSDHSRLQESEVFYGRLVGSLDKRRELSEQLKYKNKDREGLLTGIKQSDKELVDLEVIKRRLAEVSTEREVLKKDHLELRNSLVKDGSESNDLQSRLLSLEIGSALSDWREHKIRMNRSSAIEDEEGRVNEVKEGLYSEMVALTLDTDSKTRSGTLSLSAAIVSVIVTITMAISIDPITYSILPLSIAIFFLIRFASISSGIKRVRATISMIEDDIGRKELDLARIEGEKRLLGTNDSDALGRLSSRLESLNITVSSIEECDRLVCDLSLDLSGENEDELRDELKNIIEVINDHETDIKVMESKLEGIENDILSLNEAKGGMNHDSTSKVKNDLEDKLLLLNGEIVEIKGTLRSVNADITKETDESEDKIRECFEDVKKSSVERGAKISQQRDEIKRIEAGIGKVDELSLRADITSIENNIIELGADERKKMNEANFRSKRLDVNPDYDAVLRRTSRLEEEIRNDKERLNEIRELKESKDYKLSLLDKLREGSNSSKKEIERIDETLFSERSLPDIKDERRLITQKDGIIGELGSLVRKKNELRDELGLKDDPDVKESEMGLRGLEEECLIHENAIEVVTHARNSIMRKVLPVTEANMTKFLPILTADNYKDAKINKDSYQIEVYDDVAGDYRPKSVFSGGAKDQFSLALRLSFAMATLPQERGAVPGFIFLDEPIGSFDSNRKAALIELLTRGEIAENFDQVFVISHFPELEAIFDYKIELKDGKVIENNLDPNLSVDF